MKEEVKKDLEKKKAAVDRCVKTAESTFQKLLRFGISFTLILRKMVSRRINKLSGEVKGQESDFHSS